MTSRCRDAAHKDRLLFQIVSPMSGVHRTSWLGARHPSPRLGQGTFAALLERDRYFTPNIICGRQVEAGNHLEPLPRGGRCGHRAAVNA
eukprot:1189584-Prorocentrum_minimum.AAC.2